MFYLFTYFLNSWGVCPPTPINECDCKWGSITLRVLIALDRIVDIGFFSVYFCLKNFDATVGCMQTEIVEIVLKITFFVLFFVTNWISYYYIWSFIFLLYFSYLIYSRVNCGGCNICMFLISVFFEEHMQIIREKCTRRRIIVVKHYLCWKIFNIRFWNNTSMKILDIDQINKWIIISNIKLGSCDITVHVSKDKRHIL